METYTLKIIQVHPLNFMYIHSFNKHATIYKLVVYGSPNVIIIPSTPRNNHSANDTEYTSCLRHYTIVVGHIFSIVICN